MPSDSCQQADVVLTTGDVSEALFALALSNGRIAIDTETTGLDWRTERLCIVQVAVDQGRVELVRPVASASSGRSTAPRRLLSLLRSKDVVAVFHHALFDLRFLCKEYDFEPGRVVCTKIASKIDEPDAPSHSLKNLLYRYLQICIRKDLTKSDWLTAHLSPEQVRYAADDVRHLLTLWDALQQRLRAKGRLPFAETCLEFLPTLVQLQLMDVQDPFGY